MWSPYRWQHHLCSYCFTIINSFIVQHQAQSQLSLRIETPAHFIFPDCSIFFSPPGYLIVHVYCTSASIHNLKSSTWFNWGSMLDVSSLYFWSFFQLRWAACNVLYYNHSQASSIDQVLSISIISIIGSNPTRYHKASAWVESDLDWLLCVGWECLWYSVTGSLLDDVHV